MKVRLTLDFVSVTRCVHKYQHKPFYKWFYMNITHKKNCFIPIQITLLYYQNFTINQQRMSYYYYYFGQKYKLLYSTSLSSIKH